MQYYDLTETPKTGKRFLNQNEEETRIPQTDERVAIWFESIDKVKYDRAFDGEGFPILIEYVLDGDKRYSHYLEAVDGICQPDFEAIAKAELATKTAQAEDATFAYVQARVDTYNTTHGLCFANVYTCKSYADEANYAHAQFCQDVFSWNTAVWEEARVIQEKIASGELTPPETVEEYLALLPEYTGVE